MHVLQHRLPRLAAQGAGIAFLSLVLIEVALNLGAALVTDRSGSGWRPGAVTRVLAVGDSHTYGGSVPRGQDYPHQLQRFLDVVPNRAIQRAAESLAVPLVRGLEGYERVPESQKRLSWALHPSGPVYGEIARDVARQITSLHQP
jgi:hypothetical protein